VDSSVTAVDLPSPLCLAKLFKMAFEGGDLRLLRDQIITQSRSTSVGTASALISLCTIEQLLGDQPTGLTYQAAALGLHRLYQSSWPTSTNALRVLAFKAPGDVSTNTPIEFLLEGSDVVLYSLYVVPGQPVPEVPDHDIAIVTVGESDRDKPIIEEIERLVQTWPCPVLNRPEKVLQLSREGMYCLLRNVPGVIVPPTVRIDRAEFGRLGQGLLTGAQFDGYEAFPLIARPVGSHAGRGLMKLDSRDAIDAYLAGQPDAEFFISPYVDFRSDDGLFRKYRVVWVDGHPYPCHMAVADQWKVWYYNAEMDASPDKRAEEEQFMSAFDPGFAHRHAIALASMAERFSLEYVGIDCAELADGRLIVFEGDISMVVHNMDQATLYPYKGPATRKLFAAFQGMLERKSVRGSMRKRD
jgi:hypothetical protein